MNTVNGNVEYRNITYHLVNVEYGNITFTCCTCTRALCSDVTFKTGL